MWKPTIILVRRLIFHILNPSLPYHFHYQRINVDIYHFKIYIFCCTDPVRMIARTNIWSYIAQKNYYYWEATAIAVANMEMSLQLNCKMTFNNRRTFFGFGAGLFFPTTSQCHPTSYSPNSSYNCFLFHLFLNLMLYFTFIK